MTLGYLSVPLLSGVTTGTGPSILVRGYPSLTLYITGSAALSAGTLILEESDDPAYAGTWSAMSSTTLATPFASAGGKYAVHLQQSASAYVRARIGTNVVGGTVDAAIEGC